MKRGKLFYITRAFVRVGLGRWTADVEKPASPTVYVCSHNNLLGPLAVQAWLPFAARPWALHVFLDREACEKQYREYTFSKRFGLPAPIAAFLAWLVSGYVSALMSSMGALPVYRGTVKIGKTFKETVAALRSGDSVVIFPDIDYTDSSSGIGEIYDGFLLLERFWRKESEEPLRFVPLRLDAGTRHISEGRAVTFDRNVGWKTDMHRVRDALCWEINRTDGSRLRTDG